MALLYDNAIKQMFTKLYGNTQQKDTNFHPESPGCSENMEGNHGRTEGHIHASIFSSTNKQAITLKDSTRNLKSRKHH